MIEGADDILAVIRDLQIAQGLAPVGSKKADMPATKTSEQIAYAQQIEALPAEMRAIIDAIGYDPAPYELIKARLEAGVDNLSAVLVDLELQGIVTVVGGLYSRQYS